MISYMSHSAGMDSIATLRRMRGLVSLLAQTQKNSLLYIFGSSWLKLIWGNFSKYIYMFESATSNILGNFSQFVCANSVGEEWRAHVHDILNLHVVLRKIITATEQIRSKELQNENESIFVNKDPLEVRPLLVGQKHPRVDWEHGLRAV